VTTAADSSSPWDADAKLMLDVVNRPVLASIPQLSLWGGLFLYYGQRLAGGTLLVYALLSVVALIVLRRRPNTHRIIAALELVAILVANVIVVLALGGLYSSSGQFFWLFFVPLGALICFGPRAALAGFVAFLLVVVAIALFSAYGDRASPLPPLVSDIFFVANFTIPSCFVFGTLYQYEVKRRTLFSLLHQEQVRAEGLLQQTETLLHAILPESVADRIARGQHPIVDPIAEATVVVAGLVDFGTVARGLGPQHLVEVLDDLFSQFDAIATRHGLEKVRAMGDVYIAMVHSQIASDASTPHAAVDAVAASCEMLAATAAIGRAAAQPIRMRVGIHTGPVIAGVIGRTRYHYDLWGDAVTVASQLEVASPPGRIHISEATYHRAQSAFRFSPHSEVMLPGRGVLKTFILSGQIEQPAPERRVFLCYRREDSAGFAGRLFDQLTSRFSSDAVFMDLDSVAAGDDFVEAIHAAVSTCGVVLVVIGRRWLEQLKVRQQSDSQSDYVSLEVATAFEHEVPVIPILVQGAQMPQPDELPASIARLARINALELSEAHWAYDVDRLVMAVDEIRSRVPAGGMTHAMEFFGLAALGLAVGTFGTLIGAGGGFLLVPILLLLYPGDSPATITSISLAVVFLNASSGSFAYLRQHKVDVRSALWFASAAVPGSVLGALAVSHVPRTVFEVILGVVLIAASIFLLVSQRPVAGHHEAGDYGFFGPRIEHHRPTGLALAFVVGFVSSLLGIGGGILHVPALVHVLDFPVHVATATSHFVLAMTAGAGTVAHVASGTFAGTVLSRTAALGVGVVVGAQFGALWSKRAKPTFILRGLAVALLLVGARMLYHALVTRRLGS
jgi:uncharacterized protein